jgi:hypothetical protein
MNQLKKTHDENNDGITPNGGRGDAGGRSGSGGGVATAVATTAERPINNNNTTGMKAPRRNSFVKPKKAPAGTDFESNNDINNLDFESDHRNFDGGEDDTAVTIARGGGGGEQYEIMEEHLYDDHEVNDDHTRYEGNGQDEDEENQNNLGDYHGNDDHGDDDYNFGSKTDSTNGVGETPPNGRKDDANVQAILKEAQNIVNSKAGQIPKICKNIMDVLKEYVTTMAEVKMEYDRIFEAEQAESGRLGALGLEVDGATCHYLSVQEREAAMAMTQISGGINDDWAEEDEAGKEEKEETVENKNEANVDEDESNGKKVAAQNHDGVAGSDRFEIDAEDDDESVYSNDSPPPKKEDKWGHIPTGKTPLGKLHGTKPAGSLTTEVSLSLVELSAN